MEDLITNRPPAADAAGPPAPPAEAAAPGRTPTVVLLALTGVLLCGVGVVWLARYGHRGWWVALLMAVPAAAGVGFLLRAWQVGRQRENGWVAVGITRPPSGGPGSATRRRRRR
jgi:hypothetical protein